MMLAKTLRRLREARAAEVAGEGAAEGGFTLIELMVVLLIIAILLAIAIPTFLGVTNSANDRSAQSNLTNALTEASALYQSGNQSFTTSVQSAFTASAPEFKWTTAACGSSPSNCVSYFVTDANTANDAQVLVLADRSNGTNTCWYLAEVEQTPTLTTVTGAVSGDLDITQAGVYYAKATGPTCAGSDITGHTNGWGASAAWFGTYSSVTTTN